MKTKRYEVTREDIEDGERGICTKCPVALAIKRQMPSDWWVNVGGFTGEIAFFFQGDMPDKLNTRRIILQTPISVSRFMDKFDAEESAEPFSFKLPDLGAIL